MKMKFSIEGDDLIKNAFDESIKLADGEASELMLDSMKRMQLNSFKRAPVKTGFLSSNLLAEENVRNYSNKNYRSIRLIDGTEYTLVQEFTNRRKPAFIRTSIREEYPKLGRELSAWAREVARRFGSR